MCDDTLQVARPPGVDGGTGFFAPCRWCLTVPATEEIREAAVAWLGTDLWCTPDDGFDEWHDEDGGSVLPLHLRAGRDLAVRVLAWRWRLASGVAWKVAEGVSDFAHRRGYAGFRRLAGWPHGRMADLFWVIPDRAPSDLRAGRALALLLEATGGDDAR